MVEPFTQSTPCKAQLLHQGPRLEYSPFCICFGKEPFCGGECHDAYVPLETVCTSLSFVRTVIYLFYEVCMLLLNRFL